MVKECGREKITPESHRPLGTPLSSPGFPLVPLVVEWKELVQIHVTESFTEMLTTEGEKKSPPSPTITFVLAAKDFCAKATQKNAAETMAMTVLREAFMMY